jgi:hypothetical protein
MIKKKKADLFPCLLMLLLPLLIQSCQTKDYKSQKIAVSGTYILIKVVHGGKEIYPSKDSIKLNEQQNFNPDKLKFLSFDSATSTIRFSWMDSGFKYEQDHNEMKFIPDQIDLEKSIIPKYMLDGVFKIVHFGSNEMIKLSTNKTIILMLSESSMDSRHRAIRIITNASGLDDR